METVVTTGANRAGLSGQKHVVPQEFDAVAPTYDLLTSLNPGYHRHLRLSAERLDLRRPDARVLDLCCGTGASTEALRAVWPQAEIVALDASAGMLERAREKRVLSGVTFVHGDATDPRAAGVSGRFDAVLMAYGIRNLPDADRGLRNVRELLAPEGTLCLHEYSVRDSRRARMVWDAVCFGIIIPGGLVTARHSNIYRYLHKSVVEFDGVRALEARLMRAGFEGIRTLPMDGWQRGIVHSFLARRPK